MSSSCQGQGCRTHVVNYNLSNPVTPAFEEDYVLSALDLGNGELGRLGISYFDKKGGGYAVGTRRILSNAAGSQIEAQECWKAFHTLRRLQEEKNLSLPFMMINICPGGDAMTPYYSGQERLDVVIP